MATSMRVSGKRLREARLGAGMTQAQLARAVQTTERNIVRWETSQNQPRVESVAAIAKATGRDLAFFLSDADGNEDDEEADQAMRLRRFRAELVLLGRDDLAEELKEIARVTGGVG